MRHPATRRRRSSCPAAPPRRAARPSRPAQPRGRHQAAPLRAIRRRPAPPPCVAPEAAAPRAARRLTRCCPAPAAGGASTAAGGAAQMPCPQGPAPGHSSPLWRRSQRRARPTHKLGALMPPAPPAARAAWAQKSDRGRIFCSQRARRRAAPRHAHAGLCAGRLGGASHISPWPPRPKHPRRGQPPRLAARESPAAPARCAGSRALRRAASAPPR